MDRRIEFQEKNMANLIGNLKLTDLLIEEDRSRFAFFWLCVLCCRVKVWCIDRTKDVVSSYAIKNTETVIIGFLLRYKVNRTLKSRRKGRKARVKSVSLSTPFLLFLSIPFLTDFVETSNPVRALFGRL